MFFKTVILQIIYHCNSTLCILGIGFISRSFGHHQYFFFRKLLLLLSMHKLTLQYPNLLLKNLFVALLLYND